MSAIPASWFSEKWSHSLVAALLAAIIVCLIIIDISTIEKGRMVILGGFVLIAALELSAIGMAVRAQPLSLSLIIFTSAFVFWGLAPLVQYLSNSWRFPVPERLIIFAQGLVVLWLLSFLIGYRISRASNFIDGLSQLRVPITPRLIRRAWMASLAINIALIIILGPQAFLTRGSFDARLAAVMPAEELGIVLTQIIRPMGLLFALVPIAALRYCNDIAVSRWRTVVFTLPAAWVHFPLGLPRYWVFALLIGGVVFLFWDRLTTGLVVFGLTLAGLLVSSIGNAFRQSMSLSAGFEEVTLPSPATYLSRVDFDSFENAIHVLQYVQANGHTHGEHLFGAFLFWFPRALWPGKPTASNIRIYGYLDSIGYDVIFYNHAIPIPAVAWLDFGLVGVLIVGLVYGFFAGAFDRELRTAITTQQRLGESVNYVLIAGPFFVGLWLLHIRGSYYSTLAILGYYTGSSIVVYLLLRYLS